MDIEPQDHIAQDRAAPIERREVASSPYEFNGAGLPGAPAYEPFNIGVDYTGLELEDLNIPTGNSMGEFSKPTQPRNDNMSGLDIERFVDIVPLYDPEGVDSQAGVVNDARIQELRDQDMYSDGVETFPAISDTAHAALPYPQVHPSQASVETDE